MQTSHLDDHEALKTQHSHILLNRGDLPGVHFVDDWRGEKRLMPLSWITSSVATSSSAPEYRAGRLSS
jgi:hypothetical protein